jgi:hypothetical protein
VEQALSGIVERLAYEGVPVAALSRAIQLSRPKVYGVLRNALEAGRLTEIPAADWPPGQHKRARMGSGRTSQVDSNVVLLKIMQSFELTRQQALLMREMLVRPQATREQLYEAAQLAHEHGEDTEPKIVQVVICKLRRRLVKHRIKIHTIWSGGYYITRDHRLRIFAQIKVDGNTDPSEVTP